jgi:hypothetical protein
MWFADNTVVTSLTEGSPNAEVTTIGVLLDIPLVHGSRVRFIYPGDVDIDVDDDVGAKWQTAFSLVLVALSHVSAW